MQVAFADPRCAEDALVVAVDQEAEPLDVDRLLDALDRIVERRLALRGGPVLVATEGYADAE